MCGFAAAVQHNARARAHTPDLRRRPLRRPARAAEKVSCSKGAGSQPLGRAEVYESPGSPGAQGVLGFLLLPWLKTPCCFSCITSFFLRSLVCSPLSATDTVSAINSYPISFLTAVTSPPASHVCIAGAVCGHVRGNVVLTMRNGKILSPPLPALPAGMPGGRRRGTLGSACVAMQRRGACRGPSPVAVSKSKPATLPQSNSGA